MATYNQISSEKMITIAGRDNYITSNRSTIIYIYVTYISIYTHTYLYTYIYTHIYIHLLFQTKIVKYVYCRYYQYIIDGYISVAEDPVL